MKVTLKQIEETFSKGSATGGGGVWIIYLNEIPIGINFGWNNTSAEESIIFKLDTSTEINKNRFLYLMGWRYDLKKGESIQESFSNIENIGYKTNIGNLPSSLGNEIKDKILNMSNYYNMNTRTNI